MTTLENTVIDSYTVLGGTGGDNYPTLDTVTQTARQDVSGWWVLVEEDDHYNQPCDVGTYKSLPILRRKAARRREHFEAKEGQYEAAMAEYEATMLEEDRRTQTEVDAQIFEEWEAEMQRAAEAARIFTMKAYSKFAGFKPGTEIRLFDPSKDTIRTGNYRGFSGPHMVLGSIDVNVLSGEIALEPVDFQKDRKLAGNFEGRGITTYKVVSYAPGTIFEVVDKCGSSDKGDRTIYMVVTPDEVPTGATTSRKEWRDYQGRTDFVSALTVAADGTARCRKLFPSDPISPVVMTGLPIAMEQETVQPSLAVVE